MAYSSFSLSYSCSPPPVPLTLIDLLILHYLSGTITTKPSPHSSFSLSLPICIHIKLVAHFHLLLCLHPLLSPPLPPSTLSPPITTATSYPSPTRSTTTPLFFNYISHNTSLLTLLPEDSLGMALNNRNDDIKP